MENNDRKWLCNMGLSFTQTVDVHVSAMSQPYSAERPGASGQGAQWIFGTTKFTEEDHKRIQEVKEKRTDPQSAR